MRTVNGRLRVAVLDDYQHAAHASADFAQLSQIADVVTFADHESDADGLAHRLAGFQVVVGMRERTAFDAALLNLLPELALLITTGMTNASFDLREAKRLGITVCGTRMAGTATEELIWALLMSVARNIPAEDAVVRSGGWQMHVGRELSGTTLGLLGLGRLGGRIAEYAKAFNMDVIAWSQNLTQARADEVGAQLASKQEPFERADIVSIHVRLSEPTVGLVGADELMRLGPDGLLINTSRGPIWTAHQHLTRPDRGRRCAHSGIDRGHHCRSRAGRLRRRATPSRSPASPGTQHGPDSAHRIRDDQGIPADVQRCRRRHPALARGHARTSAQRGTPLGQRLGHRQCQSGVPPRRPATIGRPELCGDPDTGEEPGDQ